MPQQTQKRSRGRPRSLPDEAKSSTVRALGRGLTLLRALAKEGSITLSELALCVDMPPSSAHRILTTLQKHAFVEFDDGTQQWAVGIEAFRTGSSYLARTNLVEAAQKTMRSLMQETGETANLAIPDGGDVVFISQVETAHPIRAFFRPGTRSHMHASGTGKALLAELSEGDLEQILQNKGLPEFTAHTLTSPAALFADLEKIKKRGWSFDDEERYSGMRCVAAAIYNSFGEAIAGISISGPTARLQDDIISELGAKIRRAAGDVTTLIGGSVPGA
ncbi:MAG TPA: IclR family transcriptional regulator [Rhodospirillales bacterium]|nr:IclR family transcriptional regulator [Rhodospirillales bacterium]